MTLRILRNERGQMQAIGFNDGDNPPILRIHSIERPFCGKPDCWCKENQRTVTSLLLEINNSLLLITQAKDLKGDG